MSAAVGAAALAVGAFAGIGTAMATPDEPTVVTQPGTEAPASTEQAGTEAPPTTVQPGTEAPVESAPAQPETSVQPGTEPSESAPPSQQEGTEAPEATEQPGTQAPSAPVEQESSAPEATEQAGTQAPAQPREEATSATSQAPASAEPVETAPAAAQPAPAQSSSQTSAASAQQSVAEVQATPVATEAEQAEASSDDAVEDSADQDKSIEPERRGVTGSLDAQAPVIAGRAELTGYEDGLVQASIDGSVADTQITVVASQQIIPEPVHKAQQAGAAAQQQVNDAADGAVREAVGDERVDQAVEVSEQVQQHYDQAVTAVHEAVEQPVSATVDTGDVTVTAEVAQAEPLQNQEEIAATATVQTEAVQVDLAEDTVTVQSPDADQANI